VTERSVDAVAAWRAPHARVWRCPPVPRRWYGDVDEQVRNRGGTRRQRLDLLRIQTDLRGQPRLSGSCREPVGTGGGTRLARLWIYDTHPPWGRQVAG